MELSKERLEWITKISGRDDIEDIDGWEIREMARRLLAAEEQQPVAWKYRLVELATEKADPWRLSLDPMTPTKGSRYRSEVTPLYPTRSRVRRCRCRMNVQQIHLTGMMLRLGLMRAGTPAAPPCSDL